MVSRGERQSVALAGISDPPDGTLDSDIVS